MTVKITELPLTTSVTTNTVINVVDPTGPTSKKTTLASVANLISPTASQSVKGIVQIGSGLNVDVNGIISVPTVTTVSGNAGTVTNGVYTTGSYANPSWITSLAASKVGLGNVTNESKTTMFASPTFTGTVSGITSAMVGLGNVTNESKATMFNNPTFTGTISGFSASADSVGLGNVTNESKSTMFTSPTFTTPNIGVATATSINNIFLTAVATSARITATNNTTITLPSTTGTVALDNQVHYIGTTSITYNRASASQTLSGVSIDGNAATVTNGVYTTDTGSVTNTMLAGSIANAKLTNSSITFGSTAQALGTTVSALSGVTLDNGAIGGTTPAAGTFTTLTAQTEVLKGTGQNLALQSQSFTGWTASDYTLTPNSATAPNSTNTAATIIPQTNTNSKAVYRSIPSNATQ